MAVCRYVRTFERGRTKLEANFSTRPRVEESEENQIERQRSIQFGWLATLIRKIGLPEIDSLGPPAVRHLEIWFWESSELLRWRKCNYYYFFMEIENLSRQKGRLLIVSEWEIQIYIESCEQITKQFDTKVCNFEVQKKSWKSIPNFKEPFFSTIVFSFPNLRKNS